MKRLCLRLPTDAERKVAVELIRYAGNGAGRRGFALGDHYAAGVSNHSLMISVVVGGKQCRTVVNRVRLFRRTLQANQQAG